MKKVIFTENISMDIMVAMTDKMLKSERASKHKNTRINLLKAASAVAAIVVVIGLVNFSGLLFGILPEPIDIDVPNDTNNITAVLGAEVVRIILEGYEMSSDSLTVIPRIVERQTFENALRLIPEGRSRNVMESYYSLFDLADPNMSESRRNSIIERFPFIGRLDEDSQPLAFYVFDPSASDREIEQMIGFWNNYVGLTDEEYLMMLADYDLVDYALIETERMFAMRAERESVRIRGIPTPAPPVGPVGNPLQGIQTNTISTGDHASYFAIQPDGSLWAWGLNSFGQLGNGVVNNSLYVNIFDRVPVHIMDDVVAVSCRGYQTRAIRSDGTLWVWGSNEHGRNLSWWTSPYQIMDDVVAVSTGSLHTAVIRSDGSLWTWGNNTDGQLGNNSFTPGNSLTHTSTPIHIMDDVISASAGGRHTMAIRSDGTLWAWGSNWNGQLGNNTRSSSSAPIRIMDDVISVSAGAWHTMAIRSDGTLWAWGGNNYGQLGDGTNEERHAPVHIMDDVIAVSAGAWHTMAIRSDGSLWAWGSNGIGQLGDGTQNRGEWHGAYTEDGIWDEWAYWTMVEDNNRNSPVHIMDDVIAVSAGNTSTMAIRSDGSLWTWGGFSFGGIFGMDDDEQRMQIIEERGLRYADPLRPLQIWGANTVMLP